MAVHEAALLLLAGAAHVQRRGLHLRGARPPLLQDRQLRESRLQRAPTEGAADDESRRRDARKSVEGYIEEHGPEALDKIIRAVSFFFKSPFG
jgi:hypothetical protein